MYISMLARASEYTPITLDRQVCHHSVLGKVRDKIVLNRNERLFETSNLQFGFKVKHSATHCTFAVEEVVN